MNPDDVAKEVIDGNMIKSWFGSDKPNYDTLFDRILEFDERGDDEVVRKIIEKLNGFTPSIDHHTYFKLPSRLRMQLRIINLDDSSCGASNDAKERKRLFTRMEIKLSLRLKAEEFRGFIYEDIDQTRPFAGLNDEDYRYIIGRIIAESKIYVDRADEIARHVTHLPQYYIDIVDCFGLEFNRIYQYIDMTKTNRVTEFYKIHMGLMKMTAYIRANEYRVDHFSCELDNVLQSSLANKHVKGLMGHIIEGRLVDFYLYSLPDKRMYNLNVPLDQVPAHTLLGHKMRTPIRESRVPFTEIIELDGEIYHTVPWRIRTLKLVREYILEGKVSGYNSELKPAIRGLLQVDW